LVAALNAHAILSGAEDAPSSTEAEVTTVRDQPVLRPLDRAAFAVLTVVNVIAVALFARSWLALPDRAAHPVVFWIATLLVVSAVVAVHYRWLLLLPMRRPLWMVPPAGLRVGVATTFVPGAEDLGMLADTVRALVAMDYPHDTWVLDEGDDAAVRALCARLGAHHFSRRDVARYQTPAGPFGARTKHGNYNAWLDAVGFGRYDTMVNFDPDHVPAPHYLTRVLGYFRDPGVGYVQAAQAYYNQTASFIARGAAEETYAYYSSHQMAIYAFGHPIVTGCHTAHRAAALQAVGGFAPHDADDLLITLHYRAAGWRGVYVPEILARGLTPVDWPGYLYQQLRWARSVLDVKLRAYPRLVGRLPLAERVLALLHGCYYVRGLGVVAGYALLVYVLATGAAPAVGSVVTLAHTGTLFAVLQISNLYRQRFFLDRRREWGLHWRSALLQLAKWPWFVLALWQVLAGTRTRYTLTAKTAAAERRRPLLWPHAVVALALVAAWMIGRLAGATPPPAAVGWAAAVVVGSLALLWTETWRFPPPWQPERAPVGRGVEGPAPADVTPYD
jgi:cellulose synthase (UDP-forming)